jgi:hypothetical protein
MGVCGTEVLMLSASQKVSLRKACLVANISYDFAVAWRNSNRMPSRPEALETALADNSADDFRGLRRRSGLLVESFKAICKIVKSLLPGQSPIGSASDLISASNAIREEARRIEDEERAAKLAGISWTKGGTQAEATVPCMTPGVQQRPPNPLHTLIENLRLFIHALWPYHQAESQLQVEQARAPWNVLKRVFWETHRVPPEALRALADPALAYCSQRGRSGKERVATIEEAANVVVDLATLHACARPSFYSNQNETEQVWDRQGDLLQRAQTAMDKLRRLAAIIGDDWQWDGQLPWDLSSLGPPAVHEANGIRNVANETVVDIPPGLVEDTQTNLGGHDTEAPSRSVEGDPRGVPPQPRLENWALGLEACNKWYLFKLVKGAWRLQKRFPDVSKGREANLLKALAEGGGFLPKTVAFRLERETYSGGDIEALMNMIKPAISKLRRKIRAAIQFKHPKVDPLPFDDHRFGWLAKIEIGYAAQADGEHLGADQRLRFKSRSQLSKDEQADL